VPSACLHVIKAAPFSPVKLYISMRLLNLSTLSIWGCLVHPRQLRICHPLPFCNSTTLYKPCARLVSV